MLRGIKDYLSGLREILSSHALRGWFSSVLIRGAILGVVIITLALALGAWWIATLGDSAWFDVGAVVWVLVLLYFSGAIFGLVMALGLPILVRERKLVMALSGDAVLSPTKISIREHFKEISSSLVSVFVSIIAWPMLLIPFLMPIAVLIVAWAYAREAHATSYRIGMEFGVHVQLREAQPTKAYLLGLGLIPSVLSLVPFVAFFAWPTLLVSGLKPVEDAKSN